MDTSTPRIPRHYVRPVLTRCAITLVLSILTTPFIAANSPIMWIGAALTVTAAANVIWYLYTHTEPTGDTNPPRRWK